MTPNNEAPGDEAGGVAKDDLLGGKINESQAPKPAPVKRQAPKIITDSEFNSLFRLLTADEKAQLEKSIAEDGCRESLTVWKRDGHDDVLIDGHNRFDICTRLGIPFKVERKTFPDRRGVMAWMIRNQVGRRQLTPVEMTLFIGRMHEAMKQEQGGDRGNQHTVANHQSEVLPESSKTSEAIAEKFNVSPATVERAAELVRAVEIVKADDPDIEQKIVTGKVKPAAVKKLAKAKAPTPKGRAPKVKLDPLPMIVGRAMETLYYILAVKAELEHRSSITAKRTEGLNKTLKFNFERLVSHVDQIRVHRDKALADILEHDEEAEEFGREFSVLPVQVQLETYYAETITRLGEHVPDIDRRVFLLRNSYKTVFAAIMDIERAREIIDDDVDWTRYREVEP